MQSQRQLQLSLEVHARYIARLIEAEGLGAKGQGLQQALCSAHNVSSISSHLGMGGPSDSSRAPALPMTSCSQVVKSLGVIGGVALLFWQASQFVQVVEAQLLLCIRTCPDA
mgnify:CR=1 FL=1